MLCACSILRLVPCCKAAVLCKSNNKFGKTLTKQKYLNKMEKLCAVISHQK